MRFILSISIATILTVSIVGAQNAPLADEYPGRAESGRVFAAPCASTGNAADSYRKACELLSELEAQDRRMLMKEMTKENRRAAHVWMKENSLMLDAVFENLSSGAQNGTCDWKTDYSDGPHSVLPYIDNVQILARLGYHRALQAYMDQKFTSAVAFWADAMTLSRHVGYDPCLVCLRISFDEEQVGIHIASQIVSHASPEQRELVWEKWQTLPPRRTTYVVAKRDITRWLKWARSNPWELYCMLESSRIENGLGSFVLHESRPNITETMKAAIFSARVDWDLVENTGSDLCDTVKLCAERLVHETDRLWQRTESLPSGPTRDVARHLPSVLSTRQKECKLEELEARLRQKLRSKPTNGKPD